MLIWGYAPQSGQRFEENSLCDEQKCESDMHSAGDLAMCLGDINGHTGRHIDGLDGVHWGHGIGQRNLKGRMLLELCLEKELCVKYMVLERGKEEGDIQNG